MLKKIGISNKRYIEKDDGRVGDYFNIFKVIVEKFYTSIGLYFGTRAFIMLQAMR